MTDPDQPAQTPGLDCPECGARIPVTMEMLLHETAIECGNCGLKLAVDREKSKESLVLLKTLEKDLKKAEEKKQSPFD